MILLLIWPYYWYDPTIGMILLLIWSYYWYDPTTDMILLLIWFYYWYDPTIDMILTLIWSYYWYYYWYDPTIEMILLLIWSYYWYDPTTDMILICGEPSHSIIRLYMSLLEVEFQKLVCLKVKFFDFRPWDCSENFGIYSQLDRKSKTWFFTFLDMYVS